MRVIGVVGRGGAGKTTLIVRLIPELNRRGFSVSTISMLVMILTSTNPARTRSSIVT